MKTVEKKMTRLSVVKFTLTLVFTALTTLSIVSCKKVKYGSMTVVRDCTGTYLRSEGKDYQVCNEEKVAPFEDGAEVDALFTKVEGCTQNDTLMVCMMYHEDEGFIIVDKIK